MNLIYSIITIVFKDKNWKVYNTTDNDKDAGKVLFIKEQLILYVMFNKSLMFITHFIVKQNEKKYPDKPTKQCNSNKIKL